MRFTPTCVGTAPSPARSSCRHVRFTPTCVGTACRSNRTSRHRTVHPHVRGDGASTWEQRRTSSSVHPHVRGDGVELEICHVRGSRFTPTCVGTASLFGFLIRPQTGSPPRAWGRLMSWSESFAGRRFTPTCVGTATRRATRRWQPAVHPHVRGDGGVSGGFRAWRSVHPHVRGDGVQAGSTRAASRCAVHPHVRGDGLTAVLRLVPANGSPPRAWGRRLIVYPVRDR